MLRDAGRLPGAPTLLAQKNFLVGPRSDPPKPAGAQSSPSPSPSPSPSSPSCPQSPLARGEKRSVFPCVLFPLRKFVFRHLFAEKEPSCDQGQYTENRSSRAMRPRHSFLLRWRRFINAPGQVLPGPSPGRAGHRTPGCSCVSFRTGSGVPQIPLLRNSSTDKAEMFLKDGKRPISLAPFSPTIRQ